MSKFSIITSIISIAFLIQSCDKDDGIIIPPISIGDFHQGGVIFYLDDSGEHGLICSIEDQSFEAEWGCSTLSINGADAKEIGTGSQNTSDILAQCMESGIAAKLSDLYEFEEYNDWYLPSIDELSLIESNKSIIDATALDNNGNILEDTEYWSSTEFNGNSVWVEHLTNGDPFGALKDSNPRNVRSIRSF